MVALLPLSVAAPTVRISGLSVGAAATVLLMLTTLLATIASPVFLRSAMRDAAPFLVFAVAGTALAALQPFSVHGAQNLAMVATFGLTILLGAMPYTDAVQRLRFFDRWLTIGGLTLAAYSMFSYAVLARDSIAENRVLALALAVIVLWNWSGSSRWGNWIGYLLFAILSLTLSRTAAAATLGIGLMMWTTKGRAGGSRVRRITAAALAAVAIISLAATTDNPIRERFTTGDVSLEVFGVQVNAMGRTAMWDAVYDSAVESPLIGNGPGSSVDVLHDKVSPRIDHPHNDYLRLFHDYGIFLLLLWVGALLRMFVRAARRSWTKSSTSYAASSVDRAGAALVLLLLATMVTDNVISYVFVLGPIGYVIGLSHCLSGIDKDPQSRQQKLSHVSLPKHSSQEPEEASRSASRS